MFHTLFSIRGSVLTDIAIQTLSPRQMAWKRFKGHKAALVCCGILGFLVLAVILSPLTTRYGVNESVKAPPNSYLSPSKLAWLGTDDIGRDLYSRLIYGTRVSPVSYTHLTLPTTPYV